MSSITKEQLKQRTKQLALRVIKVFAALPHRTDAQVLGKQLLRSGTSVGAQYREATRARSTAEFVSKLESAQQELEETAYWLELISECGLLPEKRLHSLATEVNEVQAIFAAAAKTAKNQNR